MITYSVACTLQIPVNNDEPREVPAIATLEIYPEADHGAVGSSVLLEADGRDMLGLPTSDPVYLKSHIARIPAPGPTQADMDADLRLALGEHGWVTQ